MYLERRPTTETLNASLGYVTQFTSEFCAGKCEKRKDESLSVILSKLLYLCVVKYLLQSTTLQFRQSHKTLL